MGTEVKRFQEAVQTFMHKLQNALADAFRDSPLTLPQMFMLRQVQLKGPCKLAAIAEKMEVKPSAVTVMIDRLENGGYVLRHHDTVDRRSVLVEITPRGKEALEEGHRVREQLLGRYLTRLTPEEVVTITELMEKLTSES
ncbi:MarR family winged helix-turn-helix transcriptional regulator [Paenibacillus sp. D51F]